LQANKRRVNAILIREDPVSIADVNLLDKRFPEIMTGFGFGFGGIFLHKTD
jgi:hypothetical protein